MGEGQLNLENLKWKDINFNYNNREINKAKILIDKFEEVIEEKFPLDLIWTNFLLNRNFLSRSIFL